MAYGYDQIFAADPANPSNIARNAAITIYQPGDPTKTPLVITDPSGGALTNPIPVNANGFGSAFMHATLDRVAWDGGGFTGFFTSYEGMKAEAVAARTAAQEAAATAGADAAAVATAAIGDATSAAEAAAGNAAAAASNASASATAAANSAALVNSPADAAIAAVVNNSASATKTALDATFGRKREFYPEDFGADRTGATDARLAIQQAMDAARDAGGGTVLLDGTYRIDSSLLPRDNVTLQGRGWGRSIIKPPATWATSSSLIQTGGSTADPIENFFVRDIKFDLSLVPVTLQVKALFVTYMRNLRFENNWVLNSTATGIGADFLDQSIIRGNRVEGCGRYAEGNEETYLGCSGIGIGTGAWGSEATLVEGNFVINPVRYGIFVEYQGGISTFFTSGVKIINNHITGAYRGIGSDGVAWMHVTGNSVEASQQDGISVYPGNAGGKSYGDLIAHNTVMGSGRYGLLVDMTLAGNGSPADTAKYMIVNNRFINNTGVGVKIIAPSAISGVQFNGNRISGNGSIGLDLTSGGFTESDIFDNRITNNTGIGCRILGTQSKVRIKNNRFGDTRASGKTQTHGIEFSNGFTFTDFEVTGNDVTGNSVLGLSIQGTLTTCKVRDNTGYNPQGTDSLTVTASPMTYNVGPAPENLYIIGGTWTNVSLNGVNMATTSPSVIMAQPNDVVVFTYTAAPTAIKRHKL